MLVAALLAAQLVAGQADARGLSAGDIDARRAALIGILSIPPGERSDEIWKALRYEVDRLVACLDVRPLSPEEKRALDCDIRPKSEDTYLPDLITAVGQDPDPAVIPVLIKVASSGGIATAALARFGDLAVPPLAESALSSRSSPWVEQSTGAMLALARMLEQPPTDSGRALSDASRRRIVETARTVLHTKLTWVNQLAIVNLALATHDAGLRSEVEALATDASEWRRRGVTDEATIRRVQGSIRSQLARHPKH